MKKRILSVMLALFLVIGICPILAFASEDEFTIENGVLTAYNGPGGNVVIPDGVTSIGMAAFMGCENLTSITIPDGVTSIGGDAFHGCASLTNVTIPDGVTSIGQAAFARCKSLNSITIPSNVTDISFMAFFGCESLTNITIPDSVTSIGQNAFEDCIGLTDITIPNSVTDISYWAFEGCTGLTSITIPNSVTNIKDDAFCGCESLTSIQVEDGSTAYSSIDGVLYSKDLRQLVSYPGGKEGAFTIPSSVVSFGNAFGGCTSLTSITIPSSVAWIWDAPFSDCKNLVSIQVENGNTACSSIDGVLYSKDLTRLFSYPGGKEGAFTIPSGVTTLDFAFEGCNGLTSITIPDSVTSIGIGAFGGCENLTSITIPDSVTSIEESAFFGCKSLTSITIPDSVTSIGWAAFEDCENLTSITIPDSVTSIEEMTFADCKSLTSITIPDGVTSIGSVAFLGCENLTSITIPDSVTIIEESAFAYSSNMSHMSLKDVYYSGTMAEWDKIDIREGNFVLTSATIHCQDGVLNEKPTLTPSPGPTANPTPTATPTATPTITPTTSPTTAPTTSPSPETNFTDVKESAYYAQPVAWAVENGITSGIGDGKFGPENSCTRGQIVTFLWRAAGSPNPKTAVNPFKDVKSTDYYYKAVLWAVENNITSGIGNGKFGPDSSCTRGQSVTFIWRAVGSPNSATGNSFTDVATGSYYEKAVNWAVANGITSGTSKTAFSPSKTCTRGQIVTFLYRANG